jgi:hypothetical protein
VTGAALYIELLKRCVANAIYDDDLDLMRGPQSTDPRTGGHRAAQGAPCDAEQRYYGFIWPSRAHTMIGIPRLENLQHCVETVLRDAIPGDLIETGVWRGGASIFMRGILKAHGVTDRRVWVADSFAGLPPADVARYPKEVPVGLHLARDLAVSVDEVKANFARYDLLDAQVCFLQGWFRDTLPAAPIDRLAVIRLDGDMYESTMDALVHLYPKLETGGFCIVDDWNAVTTCEEAVKDYRRDHGITQAITTIPGYGAFWRKS